jgi:hypothetical protein
MLAVVQCAAAAVKPMEHTDLRSSLKERKKEMARKERKKEMAHQP